jgi:uncharacterized protein YoxC
MIEVVYACLAVLLIVLIIGIIYLGLLLRRVLQHFMRFLEQLNASFPSGISETQGLLRAARRAFEDFSHSAEDIRPFLSSAREIGRLLEAFCSVVASFTQALDTILCHILSRCFGVNKKESEGGR